MRKFSYKLKNNLQNRKITKTLAVCLPIGRDSPLLYDKWLYALKNLYKLTQRPKALCDKVFDRLFEEAEIAKFTPQEQREYEASKMAYRDIKNSIDTAKREGKEEGLAEGMEKGMNQRSQEIARKMLANGMDAATVMEITGLSEEEMLQINL